MNAWCVCPFMIPDGRFIRGKQGGMNISPSCPPPHNLAQIYALGSKQALARDGLGGSRALDATPFQGKSMFAVACSDGCIRAIRLLSEEGGSSVSVIACLDHAVPRRIRWMAKEGASLLVGTSSGSLERVDILHPEDVR